MTAYPPQKLSSVLAWWSEVITIDAENPDVSYSEAEAILVWADISEGASRPLPEWLKSIIQDE